MVQLALLAVSIALHQRPATTPAVHSRPDPDTAIVEVRIGTSARATVNALRVGDTTLLPGMRILALAGVAAPRPLHEYVSTTALSKMLHSPITTDWTDLVVTIADDGALPVSRRAARELRRRQSGSLGDGSHRTNVHRVYNPLMPRDLVIDYDVTASGTSPLSHTDVRLGLGASLMGGALGTDVTPYATAGSTVLENWLWEREFVQGSPVRVVRIGTSAPVGESVIGTGIFLSSRPRFHADSIAPVTITGTLGPGWAIDAYRNAMLMRSAQSDSSGSYAASVPLLRGANRLTVVAYGPDGERRTVHRYVLVDDNLLAPGTASYDFAVGRCTALACSYAAELSARYAPSGAITIGSGFTATTGPSGRFVAPHVSLATRIGDGINSSVRFTHDNTTASLHYAPSPAFDLFVDYRNVVPGAVSRSAAGRFATTVANAIWRLGQSGYSANATLDVAGGTLSNRRRLLAGLSMPLGQVYLHPVAALVRSAGMTGYSITGGLYAESGATVLLLPAGSYIRASTGPAAGGWSYVSLSVPVVNLGRVEMGMQWPVAGRTPRMIFSVSLAARSTRYDARSVDAGGRQLSLQSLTGSVTLSADQHSAIFSAVHQRDRAGIAGRVFLDANTNGIREPDEQLLPGISVIAGNTVVETDSLGEYRVKALVPYYRMVLEVDSLTLPSPRMSAHALSVEPLPDGVTRVDIPVVARPALLLPADVAGTSSTCSGAIDTVRGPVQHSQCRDAPPVHRHHLQAGTGDPHPVANPGETTKSGKDVAAKRRPVAVGNIEVVI